MVEEALRGVAQLVARMVWDHEVRGSSPRTPTILLLCNVPILQDVQRE